MNDPIFSYWAQEDSKPKKKKKKKVVKIKFRKPRTNRQPAPPPIPVPPPPPPVEPQPVQPIVNPEELFRQQRKLNQSRKVVVQNVPKSVTETDLYNHFMQIGALLRVVIKFQLKKFNVAFITCQSKEIAEEIAKRDHVVQGTPLSVRLYNPRTDLEIENSKTVSSNKKFFIGGIPKNADHLVEAYFAKYGVIEEFRLGAGFAFLTYKDPEIHHRIIGMDHYLNGKHLELRYELTKEQIDSQALQELEEERKQANSRHRKQSRRSYSKSPDRDRDRDRDRWYQKRKRSRFDRRKKSRSYSRSSSSGSSRSRSYSSSRSSSRRRHSRSRY